MSSLQKEPKIYGAIESQSYITFTGFCKRIYNTTQQRVDVFIDDVKIDTIQANQKIRDIENKYEVFDTNGFCFTYELPKEYIGKKHKLEFKTQEGEQLLHSPTHTIDKFSPLYNQAMFIESLKEPLKYNAIDNGYTKNALSFIAIEENLSDEDFIEFVLEMCKKHKELSLSIVYFNEHQKNQATKVLSQVKQKNFFNPSSLEELIKNSEIYLHNVVEEFRFTINEEYYNKVKNVQAIKENLFTIELTRKAKKKKAMSEMEVDTITPIIFETSVISEMFKEDERYQEFVFMNSIGRVDEEKIKDMYCSNSIGFLATKENLEDEAFMGYIKELMNEFPNARFKAFCFNEAQINFSKNFFDGFTVEFFLLQDIKEFIGEIAIFLYNTKFTKSMRALYEYIIYVVRNISFIRFETEAKEKNIQMQDLASRNSPYYTNASYFSLVIEEESVFKSIYNPILKKLGEEPIDVTKNLAIFQHFDQVKFALTSIEFAQYITELNCKYKKFLGL